MTEKTVSKELYDAIVKIFNDKSTNGVYYNTHGYDSASQLLYKNMQDLFPEILDSDEFNPVNDGNKYMAIANPETREYAYENFVIIPKKFKFYYKKTDSEGDLYSLNKGLNIITIEFDNGDASLLTKKEVIEAGYNLDMFYIE